MRLFYTATDEEIKEGKTTDIYFIRTKKILKELGLNDVKVYMEVSTGSIPYGKWSLLGGVEDAVNLCKGRKINLYTLPEGSVFYPVDYRGYREPCMIIEGPYSEFLELETPFLGLICQSSGIMTAAARLKILAKDKLLLSFGLRRMHPAIAPMISRSTYLVGYDISGVLSAEILGIEPTGTMPHSLIIVVGDQVKAWKAFDEIIDKNVKRIMLCDTYRDEREEVVLACKNIKNIFGVRLDTPGSRRGNFSKIIRECRWQLDINGFKDVKIVI